jgi:3'-phosphoadenosine 5'-phosphosulfate sulfotransferase (PAPS reductase)/FAD synthetase
MDQYDKYIVAFSGGKDSTACFLHLLDLGIPKEKIELWHHEVDGNGPIFMDWEITHDYCQKFADAFEVPIYFSYKEGGFKGEMLRKDSRTAPNYFQDENHQWVKTGGTRGSTATRMMFPQVSPDLSVRWCSPYLKIDVCTAAINNQTRFRGIRTLVVTGERGEESKARSKYEILEADRSDLRNGVRYQRYVDHARPIRDWTEQQVWEIIERYRVRVHPCYYLGFGRCSCKFCIFGNANQFASAYKISPNQGDEIISYEQEFGKSIKRNVYLPDLIQKGMPYEAIENE